MPEPAASPSRLKLLAGFAVVYLIWGSTYLAIRYAIETLPPFLMAGTRFFASGLILAGILQFRRVPAPAPHEWKGAMLVGVLLLVGGNGCVVWAEQWLPSGIAAVLIATTPFWMIFFDRWSGGLKRLHWRTLVAALCGFFGVFLLLYPKGFISASAVPLIPALVVLSAAFWWSLGSTLARFSKMPRSPWWATSIQMLSGGVVMFLLGTLRGEWHQWEPHSVSLLSAAAWLYLVFFGSIVGYSAYLWILRNSTPTRVSTYAFVNPAVALFLGWALAGETISSRTFLAAAIILPSVILLITGKEERHDRLRQSQISRGGLDSGMELP